MNSIVSTRSTIWPLWKKLIFRFLFIYLFLEATPWLLSIFPGIRSLKKYYGQLMDLIVNLFNAQLFHVKKVLVPIVSNRDTSFAWAQQWFFIFAALVGCLLWSLTDRKRKIYVELNYWLCLSIRYCLAVISFNYGFEKVFALQIPFPSQSQLATSLGDFLPMRLYWVSIGYSTSFQVFAGLTEVLTGALLVYRKTATFGALMGLAVFSNIMTMNFSYDIPVKLFSINLVVLCLYLIANEYKRIIYFLILNKPAAASTTYDFFYTNKWMRIGRIILKVGFVIIFSLNFFGQWRKYKSIASRSEALPIKPGMYDVAIYTLNRDTLAPIITDSMRWQNVVFENSSEGSIKTADTSFRQRYKRGYFTFKTDTIRHIIDFKKGETDSVMYNGIILSLHYKVPDTNTIELWGTQRNDSLYVLLKRSHRHFPLAEKQFHWLTEYSR